MAGNAQAVRGVTGLELRIQFVRRLEVRHAQGTPVAFEAVSQRGEHAVLSHPLAQVAEYLLTGSRAEQAFEPFPLLRLGVADKAEHRFREDRSLAVEAVSVNGYVAIRQQVLFHDSLEGLLGVSSLTHLGILRIR